MGTDKSLFKDNEYIDSFRLTYVDREKDLQTLDELVKLYFTAKNYIRVQDRLSILSADYQETYKETYFYSLK